MGVALLALLGGFALMMWAAWQGLKILFRPRQVHIGGSSYVPARPDVGPRKPDWLDGAALIFVTIGVVAIYLAVKLAMWVYEAVSCAGTCSY